MGDRNQIDIIGRTKLWFLLSGIVIGIGIIFMIINIASPELNYGHRYPLKLGIDFTGGNVYRLVYSPDFDTDIADKVALQADIHQRVDSMTRTIPLVQAGRNDTGNLVIQIRTDETVQETGKEDELKASVLSAVRDQIPDAEVIDESQDYVGPVIGRELAYRGIMGLVIGAILILGYVSLRMSFDFAVCAIAALVHDVLVVCGIFAIIRAEIDSSFVAAILTVVGYSINDTIVIFDRVRENTGLKKGMPFPEMVNFSLVQTLPRSINTSVTTLFPLIALLFFGGPTIKNFILALSVGVITGTYSSIFNASPILVAWRLSKKRKSLAAKELSFAGATAGGGAVKRVKSAPVTTAPDVDKSLEDLEAEESAEDLRSLYGRGKGPVRKKKKRKR